MAPKQGNKQTSGGQGKPKNGHQRPCATLNAASVPNPPVLRGVQLSRVTHGEFYYAPEIRGSVKSIEEQYNTDNVPVSRQTRSLVSFTPAA